MSRRLPLGTWSLFLSLVFAVGCGDPRIAPLRSRFVLDSEPAGAIPVSQAVAETKEPADLVVVGRICTDTIEPWTKGQAGFLLSEALADHGGANHGGAGHDAANCPFCRRRAKDAAETSVLVQFKGDDRQIIPIDARDLLGLKDNQVVVVRGRGTAVEGILLIDADGIHIRR